MVLEAQEVPTCKHQKITLSGVLGVAQIPVWSRCLEVLSKGHEAWKHGGLRNLAYPRGLVVWFRSTEA